jgi:hypothetical protein
MRAPIVVYATSSVVCAPFSARANEFSRAMCVSKMQGPHDVTSLQAKGGRTPVSSTLASRAGSGALSKGRPV